MISRPDGVPAWRRLGLVLKSEEQSGASVPSSAPYHSDTQHMVACSSSREGDTQEKPQSSSSRPSVSNTLPKLGGSSQDIGSAEEILKEGKTSHRIDDRRKADLTADSDDAASKAGLAPGGHHSRPRGDLNYRKKTNGGKSKRQSQSSPVKDRAPSYESIPLVSTESNLVDSALHVHSDTTQDGGNMPSHQGRRKRVSFTQGTKAAAVDDNSGQTLHSEKIAEAKCVEPGSRAVPTAQSALTSTNPSTSSGKKKDPSFYLPYLMLHHTDRQKWKFNKTKQSYIINNALNIFRIPDDYSEALVTYISSLKGECVIRRLRDICETCLREMNDAEAREQSQEEALHERISRERKRRKVEGDAETLVGHPCGDGYIRRLQRKRAEALFAALGRAAPVLPHDPCANGINPLMAQRAPHTRDSKKRKRRGVISSDESSSDTSSEEDSSSSESESDDTASESGSEENNGGSNHDDMSSSDGSDGEEASGLDAETESSSNASSENDTD